MSKKINVILYEPEIAQNLGSIMRTCYLADIKLHLIEPFGFIFDKRNFARSSANNADNCEYEKYDNWDDFIIKNPKINLFCMTRYGKKPISDFNFNEIKSEIFVMFGKESTGIPMSILKNSYNNFRIPMIKNGRSLNLSNSVSIACYEILRQLDYLNLSKVETIKGEDFIENN